MARGNNVQWLLRHELNFLCEPVAAAGYGNDVPVVLRTLAQCLSQQEDVPAQVGLFDKRIGPDRFQEFVFRDDLPPVANEDKKNLECLRRERDSFALAEQKLLLRVDLKRSELVKLFRRLVRACGHRKDLFQHWDGEAGERILARIHADSR
jgi:hypothetical protein